MTGTGGGRVRWRRAGGGAAGLVAVGLLLLRAGAGSLSVPFHSARELAAWLDVTAPPVVAMALVRLVALTACGYLLVALAVAVVAELAPRRRVAVLVAQLAPVALRRAVVCGARSGLVTSVALGWLGPVAGAVATGGAAAATPRHGDPGPSTATMTHLDPAQPTPPAYATMVHLGFGPTTPPTPHPAEGHPGTVATSAGAEPDPGDVSGLPEPEPGQEPDEVTGSSAAPEAAAAGAGTAVLAAPGAPGRPAPSTSPARQRPDGDPRPHDGDGGLRDDSWVVSPGDSFWSIAEETLRDARAGNQPDDAEISRYWRRLITANRDRLTAPDNPDLLTVGQVLLLPPV